MVLYPDGDRVTLDMQAETGNIIDVHPVLFSFRYSLKCSIHSYSPVANKVKRKVTTALIAKKNSL